MKLTKTTDDFLSIDDLWFAWFPVRLQNGAWVWLERVRRQGIGFRAYIYSQPNGRESE